MFDLFGERISSAGPEKVLSEWNFVKNMRLRNNQAFIQHEIIQPALTRRRADIEDGVDVPDDALTAMVQAQSEEENEVPFTDEEIFDEAMLCLAVGHETVTVTALWALYLLGKYWFKAIQTYRMSAHIMPWRYNIM